MDISPTRPHLHIRLTPLRHHLRVVLTSTHPLRCHMVDSVLISASLGPGDLRWHLFHFLRSSVALPLHIVPCIAQPRSRDQASDLSVLQLASGDSCDTTDMRLSSAVSGVCQDRMVGSTRLSHALDFICHPRLPLFVHRSSGVLDCDVSSVEHQEGPSVAVGRAYQWLVSVDGPMIVLE